MRTLIGRRDLLKLGAVTTAGRILTPRGSAPPAEAGESTVSSGADPTRLHPNRTLEALKEAVRWPTPAIPVILALTGQYLAAGRDEEAYGYFRERAATAPDQAIFVALEGTFQTRMAGQVFLLRRAAFIDDLATHFL